ncbi:MAG: hypothetical protein V4484_01210 [Pseudomonadota bacterium]
MKRMILFALLGGLSLTAPAQTAEDSQVRVRGYQIELPVNPVPLHRIDVTKYKGGYSLANGEELFVGQSGRHLYATVGGRPAKELVASRLNEFVSLDRELKISLDIDDLGDASGYILMVVPGQGSQASLVQASRLVSSR